MHTQGRWIGKPFRLLMWQKLLILALFAVDPVTKRRLYRWALIGVPKKNGKTELVAALALYFLIADGEPSPWIACAAAADEQADLVFGAAAKMCEFSPTLKPITEVFESEILCPDVPGGKIVRLASAAGTKDGPSWYVVICDELHEWVENKHERMWEILTNGVGAREQPMIIQITTAGHDLEGTICGKQFTDGMRVANGEVDDPTLFFYWWQAPEGLDYKDPATWRIANPSYGLILKEDFYRDQLTKKTEAVFRRYFLNQWTESEEIWEVAQRWPQLARPRIKLSADMPLFDGIDVALRNDSSAIVAAQRQELRAGTRIVVRAWLWENPWPRTDRRHADWKHNRSELWDVLREHYRDFPEWAREKPGPAFFYDPNFFATDADLLEGEGLNMIEFPQTDSRMIPASQKLFEAATEDVLAHDGHEGLARHIRNVKAEQRSRGFRISKPKGSVRKIDAAVAAAIAVFNATLPGEDEPDVDISFI